MAGTCKFAEQFDYQVCFCAGRKLSELINQGIDPPAENTIADDNVADIRLLQPTKYRKLYAATWRFALVREKSRCQPVLVMEEVRPKNQTSERKWAYHRHFDSAERHACASAKLAAKRDR